MVIFRNLSAYVGVLPDKGADRKITGGPCYALDRVKKLAAEAGGIYLSTRKSVRDAQELGLDLQAVAALLAELQITNYIDSEWCEINADNWLACDSYRLVRIEYNDILSKRMPVEYFFKFGINRKNTSVLMVSNHLAN